MATATLTMAGVGTVDVETEDGATVRTVLAAAAEQLGIPEPLHVIAIVDGEAVDLDDELADLTTEENPSVVAAPAVANG